MWCSSFYFLVDVSTTNKDFGSPSHVGCQLVRGNVVEVLQNSLYVFIVYYTQETHRQELREIQTQF